MESGIIKLFQQLVGKKKIKARWTKAAFTSMWGDTLEECEETLLSVLQAHSSAGTEEIHYYQQTQEGSAAPKSSLLRQRATGSQSRLKCAHTLGHNGIK